jgi:hypothetical protein
VKTKDLEIARAIARRFVGNLDEMLVDENRMAQILYEDYHINTNVYDQSDVDGVLIPFSRTDKLLPPPRAKHVVVIAENKLSYKSILYPGKVADNVISIRNWLKQTHTIQESWGLFDPVFIGRIIISQLASHRIPAIHFKFSQSALDFIYVKGLRALLSYIVVIHGTI